MLTVNGKVADGVRLVGQTNNISGDISRDLVIVGSEGIVASTVEVVNDLVLAAGASQ